MAGLLPCQAFISVNCVGIMISNPIPEPVHSLWTCSCLCAWVTLSNVGNVQEPESDNGPTPLKKKKRLNHALG